MSFSFISLSQFFLISINIDPKFNINPEKKKQAGDE